MCFLGFFWTAAYEVLNDKDKRARYDKYGEDGLKEDDGGAGHGFSGDGFSFHFDDIFGGGGGSPFDDIFGGGGGSFFDDAQGGFFQSHSSHDGGGAHQNMHFHPFDDIMDEMDGPNVFFDDDAGPSMFFNEPDYHHGRGRGGGGMFDGFSFGDRYEEDYDDAGMMFDDFGHGHAQHMYSQQGEHSHDVLRCHTYYQCCCRI